MAKTLVDIDPEKLARVQRILGTKTKRETVDRALEEVERHVASEEMIRWLASNGPEIRQRVTELDAAERQGVGSQSGIGGSCDGGSMLSR